jgi:hypothetical protein
MERQGMLANPAEAAAGAEFILEMFFGQELLASSRKTAVLTKDMSIEVPPPSGKYDPFGPGYQNDPKLPSGVPIMAVPAAIMEAIKALKKKDEVEPVPPVELKPDIVFPYALPGSSGDTIEVKARVSLGLREMSFLSYSLIDRRARPDPP